ncbi:hypothetical protein SRB5_60070 [Streptomyces sp. RB5]|uniref:DUF2690 domain-containing protein n=1 Tax=Streptomyces smaragdinus TaxID=2585196 RepID=A0A7K0CQR3_9ACTN|nr:DUF2690 domain-containing protein [Streptomyces smaragdinus]MQY15816.1 hypothetical protein [Streptomyces smaragdinus]
MSTNSTGSSTATDPSTRRSKWLSGPAALAYAVAVAGAIVAAVASPLGDVAVRSWLEEPACPGDACDDKNPKTEGCAGAESGTFIPPDNPADLRIRYSEDCHAVWGTAKRGHKGDMVTVKVTGGAERSAVIAYHYDVFTRMIKVPDGDFSVQACVIPKPGGASTFKGYCIDADQDTTWS